MFLQPKLSILKETISLLFCYYCDDYPAKETSDTTYTLGNYVQK